MNAPDTVQAPRSRILLISPPLLQPADSISELLKPVGDVEPHSISSAQNLDEVLSGQHWDMVLCDFQIISPSPAHVLQQAQAAHPRLPLIFIADSVSTQDIVSLMRQGARGFVHAEDEQQLLSLVRQELSSAPLPSKNGAIPAADMTYQSIVDHLTDLVCRYTVDMRIIFANRAYCEWQGKPVDEVIGMQILDQIPSEEQERALEHVRSLTADHPVAVSRHQTVFPDGRRRWVEWTDRAIFAPDGHVIEYQGVGRDVTELQHQIAELQITRDALQFSRDQFDQILQTTPDALLSITMPERKLIFVSASFEQVFGYPLQSFMDDPDFFKKTVHPDDLDAAINAMQQCLVTGFAEIHHRVILPDGQVRWLHRRAWVNFDGQGRPLRLNDSARDITTRKLAEEAIRNSEVNLRTMFDTIQDFLFVLDMQGNMREVNRTVLNRLGYTREELIGQPVLMVHPIERRSEVMKIVADMLAGTRDYCPVPIQAKNGQQIPVETYITQGMWDGEPALFGVTKDISQLKLSEEKFERAFHANPAIMGLSNVETGEYVEVNNTFYDKLGFTPGEVIGRKSTDILKLDPQYRERVIAKLKAQGFVYGEEGIIYTQDGRPLSVLLSAEIIKTPSRVYNFTTAVDITERKQMEEALRAGEERFRSVIASLNANIYVSTVFPDKSYRLDYISPYIETISGYSPERLMVDWSFWPSLIHADDRAAAAVQLERLTNGESNSVEYRIRTASGETRWVQDNARVVTHADGSRTIYATMMDITERKQAAVALQEAHDLLEQRVQERTAELEGVKNRLEAIFSHSGDAILLIDLQNGIQQANHAFHELVKHTSDQVIGSRLTDFLRPRDKDRIEQVIEEAARLHRVRHVETRISRDNTTVPPIDVEINVAPVNRSEKAVTSLVCIIRDISERKQAEEALRRNEQRLKLALDGTQAVVWEWNVVAGETVYSARWGEILGYTLEEVSPLGSEAWFSLVHPDDLKVSAERLGKHFAGETPFYECELRLKHKDGRWVWVWDRGMLVERTEDGQPLLVSGTVIEITERKLAEEALRTSETRLKAALYGTRAGLWEWNVVTGETTFNERWAEIIGYTLEELAPISIQTWAGAAHPDDLERSNELLQRHFSGELPFYDCEARMRHKDGRWVWVWDRGMVVEWTEDGKPLRMSGTHIDITTRVQAEEALLRSEKQLRESQKLLQLVLDTIPVHVFWKDQDSVYLGCNRLFAQHAGLKHSIDIVGKRDTDMPWAPEGPWSVSDADTYVAGDRQVMETGFSWQDREETQTNAAGQQITLLTSKHPLRDDTDKIIGAIGAYIDITARKKAENALRESEERYRLLADNVKDVIVRVTLEGVRTYVTPSIFDLLGYHPKELVGRSVFEIVHPEDRGGTQSSIRLALTSGANIFSVTQRVQHRDGHYIWVDTSITVVREAGTGNPLELISIIRDVTERRQAEEALLRSERRLRESQKLLQLVLDTIPVRVFWKDRESVYLGCNRLFAQDAGLKHAMDIVGKRDADLPWAESNADAYVADDRLVIETGVPRPDYEETQTNAAVQQITLLTSKYPLRDEDDKIIGVIGAYIDITARKKAEEALRQSEERFRVLVTSTDDIIFTLDAEHRHTAVYGSWLTRYGLTPEMFLGKSARETMPEEDARVHHAANERALKGESVVYEWPLGQEFFQTALSPLVDASNQVYGLVGIGRNITDRKRMEDALRQSEERYRLLAENIKDTIIKIRPDGIISFVTPSCYASIGYTPDELIGTYGLDLAHPDDAPHTLEIRRRSLAAHEPHFTLRERLRHKDGHYIWAEVSNTTVYDPVTGAPLEMIGVIRDVTEREQAERALQASEERYRLLAENVKDVIAKVSPQGIITYVTPSLYEVTGYRPEEQIGLPVSEVVHPDDVAQLSGTIQNSIGERRSHFTLTERLRHKAGHYVWVEVTNTTVYDPVTGAPLEMIGVMRDVTDRRLAEQALRDSEERYRLLAENVKDVIIKMLPEGVIQFVTSSCYDLVGYRAEELVGRSGFDLVHPDDVAQSIAAMQESMSKGALHVTLTERLRHRDGHYIWIELTSTTVYDPVTGLPQELIGVIRDITDRKLAEAALQASEERYRFVAENIKDVIVKLSLDAKFTFVTPSSVDLTGHTPEELIGVSAMSVVHPDDMAPAMSVFGRTMNSADTFFTIVQRVRHKAGHYRWVEVTNTIVREPGGRPLEIIGIMHDISERKQAEDALRLSEERYRSTIQTMHEGIVLQGLDGTIQLCNAAAERILGLTSDQMMGRASADPRWRAIRDDGSPFPGEDHPAMVTLRTGQPQFNVVMGVHKPDDSLTWILVNSQPLFHPGLNQAYAVVATFADITERKLAEEALKKALRQEQELGELKSRFVSMASHEFRTPLAAILSTAEILMRYRDRIDPMQMNDRLERIRQQVFYMKAIMDDVLQIARIQEGRVEFNPVLADMDVMCRDIVDDFASQVLHEGRIRYTCTTPPVMAQIDERLMRQVINNLISNALKYSPESKSVDVELVQMDAEIVLRVRDQGIGIPPDDLVHLFEPFHRARNVGTISGTGLGLNIVKQAVEKHGGTIVPETQVDVGTTFIVRLPAV